MTYGLSSRPSFQKYYKLYNFTKANSTEDFTLSVNNEEKDESSEAPEYNFLVRKKLGNTYELGYVDLNIVGDLSAKSISVDIFGDADENSGLETKSITSITEKDNDGKETKCFQLYNFDNYETIETDVTSINDYDILVRDGKELKYAKLSIDLSSAIEEAINKEIGVPTVDSNIVETKSLDEKEKDGTVYFQLHNFDVKTTIDTNVSTISQYDILIRDGDELKYTKLSIDLSSTAIELDNKSINYNDENKVQIFDFDKGEKLTTDLATLIKGSGSESEGDESNGELLFRSNG